MKFLQVLFIVGFAGLAAVPAQAKHQITRIVKKNTAADITDNFQLGPNCSDGYLFETGYVTKKPAHGSVEIVRERVQLTQKRFNFPRKLACEGATITVQFVRYTPAPGYSGPDGFRVAWGNNPQTLVYTFTVK